jgi:hypothetical protein
MGWIDDHFDREKEEPPQGAETQFDQAAQERWQRLAQELAADVAEFNSRQGGANFSRPSANQFRVANSNTGLQLTISADFDARTVSYDYEQVSEKSAGVPQGGMLSMRQLKRGGVEFYSADEQLTSEAVREVLLEPVLFPPELAA